MMATFHFSGIDKMIAKFEKTYTNSEDICGHVLFEGAKVVADKVKSAINSLPTDNSYAPAGSMKAGPSAEQKAGLVESFGITTMRANGTGYDVKVGFDGYNNVKTKTYPGGQPNAMIARSIEAGTSFMQANPFMASALKASRSGCEKAMQKEAEKQLKKYLD